MMKRMQSVCAVLVALLLLIAPARAFASPAEQDGIDPATLTAIEDAAALVFAMTGAPGTIASADEPVDEPVTDLGIFDVSELVLYEQDAYSVEIPATWGVDDSDPGGTLSVEDVDSDFSVEIESLGVDAPGLIYIPIFEGQIETLTSSLGPQAEMLPPTRFVSADGLPGLRIGLVNVEDEPRGLVDGAIYLIPTGDTAYGIYAAASAEVWSQLEAAVDEVVLSIAFAPDVITIQMAGDEPLTLVAPDELFSLDIPAGWYGSTTSDDKLSLAVSDPDIKVVGAGGLAVTADPDDETLTALTEAIIGALSPEQSAELVAGILAQMDLGSEFDVEIDDTQTTVFPSQLEDVLGIIRIVGEAPTDDFGTMPVSVYLSIYSDKVGTFVFFGDAADVAAHEQAILQIIDTLTILE